MMKQDFINAMSQVKLQKVIEKLKKEATFQNGHWSSAKYFEDDLKHKGIIPPIEIYHRYKMPYGYTEKRYEDYVMWLFELSWFESDRILNIPAYVAKITAGTNMSNIEKQEYQHTLSKTVDELSGDEKNALVQMLQQEQKGVKQKILDQVNFIKSINPELKDIVVRPGAESDFLIGVTSGFHPDDIKYFLSITDLEKARAEDNRLRKMLGMSTYALFMQPERMQKVIDAVQRRAMVNVLAKSKD